MMPTSRFLLPLFVAAATPLGISQEIPQDTPPDQEANAFQVITDDAADNWLDSESAVPS